MGCDIHAAIEVNDGSDWKPVKLPNRYFGTWKDEPMETCRLGFDRNYDAFSILANVRNGSGFAGVKTGEGFVPMSDGRGLPNDISEEAREHACTGDHSDTYVTLNDVLAYDWTRTTQKTGVVSAVVFEDWDRRKAWLRRPTAYCGDISGPRVKHVTESEMREIIKEVFGDRHFEKHAEAVKALSTQYGQYYCQVKWEEPYTHAAGQLWEKWVPLMLKLSREHKAVRMVMNFDS